MLFFNCCSVNGDDVGRDEEVVPLELPRFQVLSVLFEIKFRSLAKDLRTVVVAVLELLGELVSFSSLVVGSFLQLELIGLVVAFHLIHHVLHHCHLHCEQVHSCWINAFRNGKLRHLLLPVFAVLKPVVVSDIVVNIFVILDVEPADLFLFAAAILIGEVARSRVARLNRDGVI